MSHEVETMAYANETPWHGLGHKVDDCLSPSEILQAAQLGWTIRKVPMSAVDTELGIDLLSNKHHMLVRDNGDLNIETVDGETLPRFMDLGVCGPDYTPFQNEEVFDFFNKFTKAGQMKMETAGSLKGGQHVWALAKIDSDFELAGGDKVGGYLLLNNPHIWGKAATAMLTPIRVVCNNTLTWALQDGGTKSFRMPHMNAFSNYAKAAEEALGLAGQKMGEFKEAAEFLSTKRMHTDTMHEYLMRVFMPKQHAAIANDNVQADGTLLNQMAEASGSTLDKVIAETISNTELTRNAVMAEEAIMTSPGAGMDSARGTFWGGFNGVTYAVDHKIGRDTDTKLEQAWFGKRAALKRNALDIALDMARAA